MITSDVARDLASKMMEVTNVKPNVQSATANVEMFKDIRIFTVASKAIPSNALLVQNATQNSSM